MALAAAIVPAALRLIADCGKGLAINDLTDHRQALAQSWEKALAKSGLGRHEASLMAGSRLLLAHWLQSVVYAIALLNAWSDLGTTQTVLGGVVAAREAIHFLSAAAMAAIQPAGLLVGVVASSSADGVNLSGAKSAILYVLMPEKVVLSVLQVACPRAFGAFGVAILATFAADVCAVAALIELLRQGGEAASGLAPLAVIYAMPIIAAVAALAHRACVAIGVRACSCWCDGFAYLKMDASASLSVERVG
jgi:hypothetical protein